MIWLDPDRTDEIDDRFEYGEIRRYSTGLIQGGRFVTVIYTNRGETKRIISARKASRHE